MATLVLADDHALVREGLRRLLEADGHQVLGETGDGLRVVDLVAAKAPAILLLDLGLPGLHGLDALTQVRRRMPAVRILVLSGEHRDDFVVRALKDGAAGYLLKACEPSELLEAVKEVARGGYYVSRQLSGSIVKGLGEASPARDPYDRLTAREREVFHLVAEGLSNPEIAERLFVSPRTVETHRANVVRKLGTKTQTDVVLYALRRGILQM